ncbi:MAG: bifunctional oligoribonuclease/PAP phosphatase NrnA [Faecousia sp.]
MMKLTRAEAAEFLAGQDHFLLLTHRRPDGDTLGSAAALCLGLRSLGKTCHILPNPEITPRFRWLHQGLTKPEPQEGDTLVTVDVASPGMLPDCFTPLLDRVQLRIDHHGSATSFTPRETVDPDSASCAELVWDILECMGVSMDTRLAEAVYVGLSTDTGCFRFANTTEHTFATAAKCAGAGARLYELNQELFETNTLGRLRIQAWIVEHMQLLHDGAVALTVIPRRVEQEIGVTEDDMDNISNFPRTVAGVHIAATLRETATGEAKLSVRAVPGCDATIIARQFGGGGHKGAAGANMSMPLAEAARQVEAVLKELTIGS